MTTVATRTAPRYLDINDLAEVLGLSKASLYRWRSDGTDMPKGFKIGSRIRWTQESVDEWIEAQQLKATA